MLHGYSPPHPGPLPEGEGENTAHHLAVGSVTSLPQCGELVIQFLATRLVHPDHRLLVGTVPQIADLGETRLKIGDLLQQAAFVVRARTVRPATVVSR